eukprot:CAMPEP_0170556952 /NCGR_PEP_ID=MMETSP0211-20121228/19083_1 /TAXON_ID=311385 /ORGANISM="Pseudokeronopsis sp., Strain OXSARD2" /LENGTH=42 /DNA_ID= /DNA_START= /DNA_END= /DNA_ORIENTATION=
MEEALKESMKESSSKPTKIELDNINKAVYQSSVQMTEEEMLK